MTSIQRLIASNTGLNRQAGRRTALNTRLATRLSRRPTIKRGLQSVGLTNS